MATAANQQLLPPPREGAARMWGTIALAGLAMAMWAMTTLVAPVMGPLLGGWITDNISWAWIFYINVPVGVASAFATLAIYRKRESHRVKLPIDKVGLALLVVWVGC